MNLIELIERLKRLEDVHGDMPVTLCVEAPEAQVEADLADIAISISDEGVPQRMILCCPDV